MFFKGIGLIGLIFVVAACSASSNNSSAKYSYDMTLNGCKTGSHSFDSKDAYCKGLLDDNLNNNCAYEMRASSYKNDCGALPVVSNNQPLPQTGPQPTSTESAPNLPTDEAAAPSDAKKDGKLGYIYNQDGCSTGQHTFSTKKEYCAGLLNEELNHYCAQTVRYFAYNMDCVRALRGE